MIAGLAVTQLIGWGTLFYPIAVIGRAMGTDLALPKEAIFAGIGIMLLAGAAIAPRVGKRLDRNGPRAVMAVGSLVATSALILLSQASNALTYGIGWILVGLALPTALGNAAFTALSQVAGAKARRAITALTFFSGLASTVFWPLTTVLEAQFGWRETLVMFAALNIFVALPIHLLVLPTRSTHRSRVANGAPEPATAGILPVGERQRAFVLLALALSAHGVVGWGLALHFIEVFQLLGLGAAVAVTIAALNGILQVTARGAEFLLGGRHPPIALGLMSGAMLPLAFAAFFLGGASSLTAVLFMVFYSMASGLMTIVRATLPLWLFGKDGYGARLGKLMAAQNLVFAASPILFAAVIDRAGPWTALAVGGIGALAALAAMALLARLVAQVSSRETP
jgi:MFS family permease